MTRRTLFGLVLLTLASAGACSQARDPLPQFPRVVLYAWERPEQMDFVDPKLAGVAFLARTVSWVDGQISSRPRLQPLHIADGTAVMAVVRLESTGPALPDIRRVAREIVDVSATRGIHAIQVDFDATESERRWYATLLGEVRREISPDMPLSIAALASWCRRDGWIRGLPLDEAVPMLYRMGRHEPHDVADLRVAICRTSVAISTDEQPESVPRDRRVFVFHPRAWDRESYRQVMQFVRGQP